MVKEVKTKQERGDKMRNRANVIKEIIKDPTQSQRAIAKKVGIGKSTVNDHIQKLPNSDKNGHINKILEKDLNIVNLAQEELVKRLKNPDEISTRDIIASADVSAKRYSLFKGTATDNEGGLKDTSIKIEII